jgi:uroporphyrinogen-III synthase
MQTTNSDKPLNVLVVRPAKKAQALTSLLNKQGIACVSQPLFDYQSLAKHQQSEKLLTTADIIIFVSVAAVEFANATIAAKYWQYQHIIAVGKATKAALHDLALENVEYPSQENSEGLLMLNILNKDISHKNITIVRGNGGREHLATELNKRGATTQYLESYQRVWRTFPKDIDKQWYQQQINCIVVTSNAILEKLVQLTQVIDVNTSNDKSIYWRDHCNWIVASKRIFSLAKQLGLVNVIQSDGANEQAISAALKVLMIKNIK